MADKFMASDEQLPLWGGGDKSNPPSTPKTFMDEYNEWLDAMQRGENVNPLGPDAWTKAPAVAGPTPLQMADPTVDQTPVEDSAPSPAQTGEAPLPEPTPEEIAQPSTPVDPKPAAGSEAPTAGSEAPTAGSEAPATGNTDADVLMRQLDQSAAEQTATTAEQTAATTTDRTAEQSGTTGDGVTPHITTHKHKHTAPTTTTDKTAKPVTKKKEPVGYRDKNGIWWEGKEQPKQEEGVQLKSHPYVHPKAAGKKGTSPHLDSPTAKIQKRLEDIREEISMLEVKDQQNQYHSAFGTTTGSNENPKIRQLQKEAQLLTRQLNEAAAWDRKSPLEKWQSYEKNMIVQAKSVPFHKGYGTAKTHYNTPLNKEDEVAFENWFSHQPEWVRMKQNTYDLKGLWKYGGGELWQNPYTHDLPETWKKPTDATFSDHSIYAKEKELSVLPGTLQYDKKLAKKQDTIDQTIDTIYTEYERFMKEHPDKSKLTQADVLHLNSMVDTVNRLSGEQKMTNASTFKPADRIRNVQQRLGEISEEIYKLEQLTGDNRTTSVLIKIHNLKKEAQDLTEKENQLTEGSFERKLLNKVKYSIENDIIKSSVSDSIHQQIADTLNRTPVQGDWKGTRYDPLASQIHEVYRNHTSNWGLAGKAVFGTLAKVTMDTAAGFLGWISTGGDWHAPVTEDNPLGAAALHLRQAGESITYVSPEDLPTKWWSKALYGGGKLIGEAAGMYVQMLITGGIASGIVGMAGELSELITGASEAAAATKGLMELKGLEEGIQRGRMIAHGLTTDLLFTATGTQEQATELYHRLDTLRKAGIPEDATPEERKVLQKMLDHPEDIDTNLYAMDLLNMASFAGIGKAGPAVLQQLARGMAERYGVEAAREWLLTRTVESMLEKGQMDKSILRKYGATRAITELMNSGGTMAVIGAASDMGRQMIDNWLWDKDIHWGEVLQATGSQFLQGSLLGVPGARGIRRDARELVAHGKKMAGLDTPEKEAMYRTEHGRFTMGLQAVLDYYDGVRALGFNKGDIAEAERVSKDIHSINEYYRKNGHTVRGSFITSLAESLYTLDAMKKAGHDTAMYERIGKFYDWVDSQWRECFNPMKGEEELNESFRKVMEEEWLKDNTNLTEDEKSLIASYVSQTRDAEGRVGQALKLIRANAQQFLMTTEDRRHLAFFTEKAVAGGGDLKSVLDHIREVFYGGREEIPHEFMEAVADLYQAGVMERKMKEKMEKINDPKAMEQWVKDEGPAWLKQAGLTRKQGDNPQGTHPVDNADLKLSDIASGGKADDPNRGKHEEVWKEIDRRLKENRRYDGPDERGEAVRKRVLDINDHLLGTCNDYESDDVSVRQSPDGGFDVRVGTFERHADTYAQAMDILAADLGQQYDDSRKPDDDVMAEVGRILDIHQGLGDHTEKNPWLGKHLRSVLVQLKNRGNAQITVEGQHLDIRSDEGKYWLFLNGDVISDEQGMSREEMTASLYGQLSELYEKKGEGPPALGPIKDTGQKGETKEEKSIKPNEMVSRPSGYHEDKKVGHRSPHNDMSLSHKVLNEKTQVKAIEPNRQTGKNDNLELRKAMWKKAQDILAITDDTERAKAIEAFKADTEAWRQFCDKLTLSLSIDGRDAQVYFAPIGRSAGADWVEQRDKRDAFIEQWLEAGGNPKIQVSRNYHDIDGQMKDREGKGPFNLKGEEHQKFIREHNITLTSERGGQMSLTYRNAPQSRTGKPVKIGTFIKALGNDSNVGYFGNEQVVLHEVLAPVVDLLKNRPDTELTKEEWKALGIETGRDDLTAREVLSYFLGTEELNGLMRKQQTTANIAAHLSTTKISTDNRVLQLKPGEIRIGDFHIADGETLSDALLRNGFITIYQDIRYPFLHTNLYVSIVKGEASVAESKEQAKKPGESGPSGDGAPKGGGGQYRFEGGVYTHIDQGYIYDGIKNSVAVSLASENVAAQSFTADVIEARLRNEINKFRTDLGGKDVHPKDKENWERAILIREDLLKNLKPFTDAVNRAVEHMRDEGAFLRDVEEDPNMPEHYTYLHNKEGVDPYWQSGQKIMSVIGHLLGAWDPVLTMNRVVSPSEAKRILMYELAGYCETADDIVKRLKDSLNPVVQSFAEQLKRDPSLLTACWTLFQKERKTFGDFAISYRENKRPFMTVQTFSDARHDIRRWNEELPRIAARNPGARLDLKKQVNEIAKRQITTMDEKCSQIVEALNLLGIHNIDDRLLKNIAQFYYDKVLDEQGRQEGPTDEVMMRCLELATEGETANRCMAILGVDDPIFYGTWRKNQGIGYEGILNEAKRLLEKVILGQSTVKTNDYDQPLHRAYEHTTVSMNRLAAYSHHFGGDVPSSFTLDVDGKKVYQYQDPTFLGQSMVTLLKNREYIDSLLKNPVNRRSHYLNALKGGKVTIAGREALSVLTPDGKRKKGTEMTAAELLAFRWQAALTGLRVLRQIGDHDRTSLLEIREGDNFAALPQEYWDKPSRYILDNWVASHAEGILAARKIRARLLSDTGVASAKDFDDLTGEEQMAAMKWLSPDHWGLVENVHYKWAYDSVRHEMKMLLEKGSAYESKEYDFLNRLLPQMEKEGSIKALLDDKSIQKEIADMISNTIKDYIEQLHGAGLLDLDMEKFVQSATGLDAIKGYRTFADRGYAEKSWLFREGNGENRAAYEELAEKFLGKGAKGDLVSQGRVAWVCLAQLFDSIELDPLLFGDQSLYGGRNEQNKRISGEYSTGRQFNILLPENSPYADEFNGKPKFRVLDAFDLNSINDEDYKAFVAERVGTLANPSRVLKLNLDARHTSGSRFHGKSEQEVLAITQKEAEETLAAIRTCESTDGQSFITPAFAREMKIRLGDWTKEQEEAYQAYRRGEDPSVWQNQLVFTPMKCMYWGPDSATDLEGNTVTGHAFYKTAYQPLADPRLMDEGMKKLIQWMEDNDIGVLSFGSANKVFGGDKAFMYDRDGNIRNGSWHDKFVRECDWQFFRHQLPKNPHGPSNKRFGIQFQKDLHEAAAKAPALRAEYDKVLGKIADYRQKQRPETMGERFIKASDGNRVENTASVIAAGGSPNRLPASSAGTVIARGMKQATETTVMQTYSTIVSAAAIGRKLVMRDQHGLAECVINVGQLSDIIPEGLTFEQQLKLFQKLQSDMGGKLQQLNYRVPTTGTASTDSYNVVDITNNDMGEITILPPGLMKKDGHDNDIDANNGTRKSWKWVVKDMKGWKADEEMEKGYQRDGDTHLDENGARHKYAAEHQAVWHEKLGRFLVRTDRSLEHWMDHVKAEEMTGDDSIGGLTNQLIDVAHRILRSPEGAACNTSTIDGPTIHWKSSLRKYLPEKRQGRFTASTSTLVQEHDLLDGGRDIGIMALAGSVKPIIDHRYRYGSLFDENSPFRLRKGGNTELNKQGGFINDDLGAMVSLAVDDPKDPLLGRCNINDYTKNMLALLNLEGHGVDSGKFVMQAALVEYSRIKGQMGNKGRAFQRVFDRLLAAKDGLDPSSINRKVREAAYEDVAAYLAKVDIMDSGVLDSQLTTYKEYMEKGTQMNEWSKDFLAHQMAVIFAAEDLHSQASKVFRLIAFNKLDADNATSMGSVYTIMRDLWDSFDVKVKKGLHFSPENILRVLGDPVPGEPYWIVKARKYMENLREYGEAAPMLAGDRIFSAMYKVMKGLPQYTQTNETIENIWKTVNRQVWAEAFFDAGIDIDPIIRDGEGSLMNQYEKLKADRKIRPSSLLSQLLRVGRTQYVYGEEKTDRNGNTVMTNQVKVWGGAGFDQRAAAAKDQYADIMRAISEAAGDKKDPEVMKFINDLIVFSYVTDRGVIAHCIPGDLIAKCPQLAAAEAQAHNLTADAIATATMRHLMGKDDVLKDMPTDGSEAQNGSIVLRGERWAKAVTDVVSKEGQRLAFSVDKIKKDQLPPFMVLYHNGTKVLFARRETSNVYQATDPTGYHLLEGSTHSSYIYHKSLSGSETLQDLHEMTDYDLGEGYYDKGHIDFGNTAKTARRAAMAAVAAKVIPLPVKGMTDAQVEAIEPILHKAGYLTKRENGEMIFGTKQHRDPIPPDSEMAPDDWKDRSSEAKRAKRQRLDKTEVLNIKGGMPPGGDPFAGKLDEMRRIEIDTEEC